MFKKSPFSEIPDYIGNNNLVFHNENQNSLKDSSFDYFSIEDKKKQNFQPRTKQRFGFYNNGTPSQVKQYLDYFLKESNSSNANVNFMCFTGKDNKLNFNNDNNKEKKLKNSSTNEMNNQHQNNFPEFSSNNSKSKNEDDKEGSCPAPPCKISVNSCLSASTFNSSTNSNINNNSNAEQLEANFNLLSKDLEKMALKEKDINPHIKGRVNKLYLGY